MKAIVSGHVVAESDDIVDCDGYPYFPNASVKTGWLEKAPKTESDLECPHGVQFYDVVVEGERHARAAWRYEKPRPEMRKVADRFSFWEDVEIR